MDARLCRCQAQLAEDFMNIIIHLSCLLEAIRLERDEGFPSLQVLHTREAKTD
jgi:hypothetical protein